MSTVNTYSRILLGFALFLLLFGVYMLTYRGIPMSGDEIFIFDSTESLARRGELNRTYQFNEEALQPLQIEKNSTPWPPPKQEPLMPVLAVPLFWLAENLSGVGTMHIMWLFNIFLTALTAVCLYLFGLLRGYATGVAWIAALLFGIATNAWVYSRLFFREPVMSFFILFAFGSALLIQDHWQKGRLAWRWFIVMGLSFAAALIAKAVSIVLLPALLLVLFPPAEFIRKRKSVLGVLIAGGTLLLIMLFAVMNSTTIGRRYAPDQIERLTNINWEFVLESLLGYQIGVSRSIWLYSPVLLLGIWGAWILFKQKQWRPVAAMTLAILLFSFWYGVALSVDWSGGWGWGPRYFLPFIPIMILFWVMPSLEYIHKNPSRLGHIVVVTLSLLGITIQLLGMAVPLSNYYTDLFRAGKIYDYNNYVAEDWHWMEGNWTLKWSPIYYHLDRLDFAQLDFAWRFADESRSGVIVAAVALAFLSFVFALNILRRRKISPAVGGVYLVSSFLASAFILSTGLTALYEDERYIGEWQDVSLLIDKMNDSVAADDIVFIDREQYTLLFMNYFKTPALLATLPYAPAENYGAAQPAVSPDAPVEEQIGYGTVEVLQWVAENYATLWLVASSSPFETDKIRPVERYLTQLYFPVSEITTSFRARAIRFVVASMPTGTPEQNAGVVFGDQLELNGYDLPSDNVFHPGDGLPVSLVWTPVNAVSQDYNVGIYLLDSAGAVVTQRDSLPLGTFGYTSRWQLGTSYHDNHGLVLPSTLAPGDYQLLVALYFWQDGKRLEVKSSSGEVLGDLYQLATIQVK